MFVHKLTCNDISNTVKSMGHKPSVAIIAHSNFGSSDDFNSQNSRQAIKILDSQERNFEYDGEMSIDTAINSEAL